MSYSMIYYKYKIILQCEFSGVKWSEEEFYTSSLESLGLDKG